MQQIQERSIHIARDCASQRRLNVGPGDYVGTGNQSNQSVPHTLGNEVWISDADGRVSQTKTKGQPFFSR